MVVKSTNCSLNQFSDSFFLPGISSILLLEVPMRGFCEFAVACVVGYVQFSIVVEFSQGSHSHHISIVRFQYFNQQLLLC